MVELDTETFTLTGPMVEQLVEDGKTTFSYGGGEVTIRLADEVQGHLKIE